MKTVEALKTAEHDPSPLWEKRRNFSPKTVPKFIASRETSPHEEKESKWGSLTL